MEDYRVGFSKMFIQRNNKEQSTFYIGSVIQVDPLKLSIGNGQAYFTENDNLIVCETLKGLSGSITLDSIPEHESITTNFTITRNLSIGDNVLCFPLDSVNFIAFDKI